MKGWRVRRLRAWRALLATCILFAIVPDAGGRGSAADPQAAFPAPAPAFLPLLLRAVSHSGDLQPAGATWRVGAGGGALVLQVMAGEPVRSISIAGVLQGPGIPFVQIRRAAGWQTYVVDEPTDRDAPGLFSVGPIPLTAPGATAQLRLSIEGGAARSELRDLRAYALAGQPGLCVAPGCQASGVPAVPAGVVAAADLARHGPTATATATPSPAWQAPRLASDTVQIISRDAWGSPDGERSPSWIPFYKVPFHIVVHHTAEDAQANPLSDLQGIWEDHALTRGWGDIGYNYVIDPEGRIYEGRAGGDQVAGAHTQGYNIGSIGISLIGNYDVSIPPAPMLLSLRRLVTRLADTYGISVNELQNQDTLTFYGLAGHRNFNQTDCPGDNVYALLPQLRALIAHDVRSSAALGGSSILYAHAGSADAALLVVRNTGTTTWNGRFSLRRLSGPLLGLPSGYDLPEVSPGGTITIPLFLPALAQGSSYSARWQLFDAAGAATGAPFTTTIQVLAPGAATPTALPTATNTHTVTATRTPTHSPTVTPTRTRTPSPTRTRMPSPTRTPRPTPRPRVTITRPTRTATPRPTRTPTPHPTRTPTPRPTRTSTPHPTSTSTPRPHRTATPHPTSTSTSRPHRTATPHRTPAPRPTHTPTPAPSWTPAPTITRAPTASATSSNTPTPSASPSTTPTTTVTWTAIVIGTDTPVPPIVGAQSVPAARVHGISAQTRDAGQIETSASLAANGRTGAPTAANPVGAATTWYLADGASDIHDRETIALYNPSAVPAYVVTTLVRGDGRHVYVVNNVPPYGRGTLDASDAAGLGDALGAIIHSSQPIYVERTVYHSSAIEEGTGAALLPGIPAPASHWYLPRLRLVADEAEQIAILNPAGRPVTVEIAVTERHVSRPLRQVTIPALAVKDLSVPGGAASAIVRVVSPGTGGVVVEEHTLYGHDSGYTAQAGLTALAPEGYLLAPEAGTGQDYLMLLNPGTHDARVTLTGFDARGARLGALSIPVPGGQDALERLPASAAEHWQALQVQSNVPIAASYVGFLPPGGERALARTYIGSVSAALSHPARSHVFAEGDTRALLSAPRETLLLANPGRAPARVQVLLQGTGGRHLARSLVLDGGAFLRLPINGWAPPGQHSLIVQADRPILAARSIDFNEGNDRLLSYGIDGA